MQTKLSRLATLNAEMKARTIGIRLIRALLQFGFVVQRAIVKVIIAVRRKSLLAEGRSNRSREYDYGHRNQGRSCEPKLFKHGRPQFAELGRKLRLSPADGQGNPE